jgi:ATP-dependent DNA helicase RecQ
MDIDPEDIWEGEASRRGDAAPLVPTLDEGLQSLFGFSAFRPGQRDVMDATLKGLNALVVMPTGSGKSLCYQLPACVLDGITLVVSPLIALMKDQVDALEARGIPAVFINSSLTAREQRDRLFQVESGQVKLVYIAPERFRNQAFCDAIAHVKIGLLAIDEAHCISSWGHDFRPDYLRLAEVRKMLGEPTTIALTATATSQVQQDILEQLQLDRAGVFVYGFERPNLYFEVHDARSKQDKLDRMEALLRHVQGKGTALIYCATRKQVEEVADELLGMRIRASVYHAGLTDTERARVQDDFMAGNSPVLVATNAFGMGVDKSDIRAIVHFNMPGSLEAYYQEAGRAGRDGEDAHCLLLFNYADRGIHEFFVEQTYPTPAVVERIWEHLRRLKEGTHPVGPEQVAQAINRQRDAKRMNSWGVESAMRIIQRAGYMEFGTRDGFPWCTIHETPPAHRLQIDWEHMNARRQVVNDLITDVVRYASARDCRQLALLRYFNSKPSFEGGCGHCDACTVVPDYMQGKAVTPTMRIVTDDTPKLIVQKLLSGVARARGRWGAHIVAGMLRGSSAQKVVKARLNQLTTFGLLSYMKQPDVVMLLDMCLRLDLLARDEHGCLSITNDGAEVMRGAVEVPAMLDDLLSACVVSRGGRRAAPSKSAAPAPRASSPPARPAPGSAAANAEEDAINTLDDTYLATLRMLEEGKDLQQIATARSVSAQTVLRHLMVLADAGEQLVLDPWINADLMARVRTAAQGWSYGEPLANVKAGAEPCTYDSLKIHLAQLLLERHGHG